MSRACSRIRLKIGQCGFVKDTLCIAFRLRKRSDRAIQIQNDVYPHFTDDAKEFDKVCHKDLKETAQQL